MSFGMCCFLCLCFYQLGAYNQRNPGELRQRAVSCWAKWANH